MREALAMLRQPRSQLCLFLLVTFGGLALLIPKVSHYYGDESLYTDAALRMAQTGEYCNSSFKTRFRRRPPSVP